LHTEEVDLSAGRRSLRKLDLMTFESLLTERPLKNIIILVLEGSEPSINYSSSNGDDIYIIRNAETFLLYIGEIFQLPHKLMTIVSIIKEISELVQLLRFVHTLDQKHDLYKKEYIDDYQHQLKQLHPDYEYNNEASFGEYAFELPLSCNLVLVLDSLTISDNHLSTSSISKQQYLRYFALKHGAKVISTSSIDTLLQDPSPFIHFQGTAKPIFDVSTPTPGIPLHLNIPRAWDSSGKILLLAKSVMYEDHSELIGNAEFLHKLDENYSNYFKTNNLDEFLTFINAAKNTSPNNNPQPPSISLNDILKHCYIEP
jgi:hypothetical protein